MTIHNDLRFFTSFLFFLCLELSGCRASTQIGSLGATLLGSSVHHSKFHWSKVRLNRLLDPRVQRYFEEELKKGKQQSEALEADGGPGGSTNFATVLLILKLNLLSIVEPV